MNPLRLLGEILVKAAAEPTSQTPVAKAKAIGRKAVAVGKDQLEQSSQRGRARILGKLRGGTTGFFGADVSGKPPPGYVSPSADKALSSYTSSPSKSKGGAAAKELLRRSHERSKAYREGHYVTRTKGAQLRRNLSYHRARGWTPAPEDAKKVRAMADESKAMGETLSRDYYARNPRKR